GRGEGVGIVRCGHVGCGRSSDEPDNQQERDAVQPADEQQAKADALHRRPQYAATTVITTTTLAAAHRVPARMGEATFQATRPATSGVTTSRPPRIGTPRSTARNWRFSARDMQAKG